MAAPSSGLPIGEELVVNSPERMEENASGGSGDKMASSAPPSPDSAGGLLKLSKEHEDVLSSLAESGETIAPWVVLKPIIYAKLSQVLDSLVWSAGLGRKRSSPAPGGRLDVFAVDAAPSEGAVIEGVVGKSPTGGSLYVSWAGQDVAGGSSPPPARGFARGTEAGDRPAPTRAFTGLPKAQEVCDGRLDGRRVLSGALKKVVREEFPVRNEQGEALKDARTLAGAGVPDAVPPWVLRGMDEVKWRRCVAEMRSNAFESLAQLYRAPCILQRLCELLVNPTRDYSDIFSYSFAVEQMLRVGGTFKGGGSASMKIDPQGTSKAAHAPDSTPNEFADDWAEEENGSSPQHPAKRRRKSSS